MNKMLAKLTMTEIVALVNALGSYREGRLNPALSAMQAIGIEFRLVGREGTDTDYEVLRKLRSLPHETPSRARDRKILERAFNRIEAEVRRFGTVQQIEDEIREILVHGRLCECTTCWCLKGSPCVVCGFWVPGVAPPPFDPKPWTSYKPTQDKIDMARETLQIIGRVDRAPWSSSCEEYDLLVSLGEATLTQGSYIEYKGWTRIYSKIQESAPEDAPPMFGYVVEVRASSPPSLFSWPELRAKGVLRGPLPRFAVSWVQGRSLILVKPLAA